MLKELTKLAVRILDEIEEPETDKEIRVWNICQEVRQACLVLDPPTKEEIKEALEPFLPPHEFPHSY